MKRIFVVVNCVFAQCLSAQSISWLTYLGGTSSDEFFSVVVTPDSGCVVVGRTSSSDYPATTPVLQDTLAGNYDAVIARFGKNGNCLWSRYYGGTDFDGAWSVIRKDSLYYVCGNTRSTDLQMINASQNTNAGSYDGFIAVFNDSGVLVRSTYYGGTGGDQFFALAIDTSGRIIAAGSSSSTSIPATAGQYQTSCAGAIDACIVVFSDQLVPQWATYYGGSNTEDIHSITTTQQGEIVIAGGTYSNNFPFTANAYQPGMLGMPDCYLVKFGMDGTRHYATFFGGTASEDCNTVVSDSLGNIYATGFTYSPDFPIMGNSFQTSKGAQNDAFLMKFDANGQPAWSTFLGGIGQDNGLGLVRAGKYLYVCGNSESPDFPVSANAIQNTYAANSDGYVMKFDTTGSLVCGTFMGGGGSDALYGIDVTRDTSVISCGTTYSTDLPVTPGAFQMTNMSSGDGYVVKFGMSEQPLGNNNSLPDRITPEFTLYPIPTTGLLNIGAESVNIVSIDIYDAAGKLVKTMRGDFSSGTIDVSELSPGYYSLAIHYLWGSTDLASGLIQMTGGFPFIKK